jgi:ATP-dependent helicase YprA (DUF1998 family)
MVRYSAKKVNKMFKTADGRKYVTKAEADKAFRGFVSSAKKQMKKCKGNKKVCESRITKRVTARAKKYADTHAING